MKKLTHSQFIVYLQQIKQGKPHVEALKYCLRNKLNVGEYLYTSLRHNK